MSDVSSYAGANTSDEQLILETATGNKRAFDILYVRYYPRMVRAAFRFLKDEDAVGLVGFVGHVSWLLRLRR